MRCVRCRGSMGPRASIAPMPHIHGVRHAADHGLRLDQPLRSGGEPTAADSQSTSPASDDGPSRATPTPIPSGPPLPNESIDDLEDWTLGAELQRIRRRFDRPAAGEQSAGAAPAPHFDNFSLPGSPLNSNVWPGRQPAAKSSAATGAAVKIDRRKRRRSSPLVWGALSLGLMAFVCGTVLLGWSLAVGRSDLWNLGMPITLGGQFGLLLGLLLQLENLWEGNRHTVDKLDEVDNQLEDLKQTAALITSGHSSPAQAFYVHMAGGASPHLLLADLKGQLDLLAVQMAATRR